METTSGVVSISAGDRTGFITLRALQDVEAESNEVFSIKLITCKGGARISETSSLAKLTGMTQCWLND